jgi:hypothetical protein
MKEDLGEEAEPCHMEILAFWGPKRLRYWEIGCATRRGKVAQCQEIVQEGVSARSTAEALADNLRRFPADSGAAHPPLAPAHQRPALALERCRRS